MMKNKISLLGASAILCASLLSGCGGNSGKVITIWVGQESVDFYQEILSEYAEKEELGYRIKVTGTDLGSIAGAILNDSSTAGDIYSVAHDNVGKLAQHGDAKPIFDEDVIAQFREDNSEEFQKVCHSKVADKDYVFAVPYISQALYLMYNKEYVTEEEAKTFEGLEAAATRKGGNTKAFTVKGDDGFNFSFTLLALPEEPDETGARKSSLELYENFERDKAYCQGDDEVAFAKWIRNSKAREHGFTWASDALWDADMRAGNVLGFICGSWTYNAFKAAVGADHIGLSMIPTFTLTEDDAFGTATAGTTYRGGTFADCKVLMINSHSSDLKYKILQKIVKYMSSTEVQVKSFARCLNTPAYKTFGEDLNDPTFVQKIKDINPEITDNEIKLADVQAKMIPFGRPQPINSALLNNLYYQLGGPGVYRAIVDNEENVYGTDRSVQEGLYRLNYIWIYGKKTRSIPDTLPQRIELIVS